MAKKAIVGGVTYDPQGRREAIAEMLHELRPDLHGDDFEKVLERLVEIDAEMLKIEG